MIPTSSLVGRRCRHLARLLNLLQSFSLCCRSSSGPPVPRKFVFVCHFIVLFWLTLTAASPRPSLFLSVRDTGSRLPRGKSSHLEVALIVLLRVVVFTAGFLACGEVVERCQISSPSSPSVPCDWGLAEVALVIMSLLAERCFAAWYYLTQPPGSLPTPMKAFLRL